MSNLDLAIDNTPGVEEVTEILRKMLIDRGEIEDHQLATADQMEETFISLLGNMAHTCDASGFDFGHALFVASVHYNYEAGCTGTQSFSKRES